jgi:hypothetical protein
MKRFLLVSVLLMTTLSLFAAKPLKVAKGGLNVFKEDATASWAIDFSDAQFVNNGIFSKEKLGDFRTWCGDGYDELVHQMETSFFGTFNVYSPGLELVNSEDAPYKVLFKVDTLERTQGSGPLGSCYISLYGTLRVVEAATGAVALELKVTDAKGEEDFDETSRFPKAMKRFCQELFNLKK